MKSILALTLLISSLTAFSTTVKEELSSKSCGVRFNKTLYINESDSMIELGQIMLAPLINERNVLFKKGITYPISEVDDEVITLTERENIVFMCVTDESKECVKLTSIEASEFTKISNNNLEIVCE